MHFWLIVILGLILALAPVLVYLENPSIAVITYKDWLNYYGMFVGSFVGVLVAFAIARYQISSEQEKEKVKETKNTLKAFYVINSELEKLEPLLNGKDSLINQLHWHLNSESNYKSSSKNIDKITYARAIQESIENIKQIKNKLGHMKDTLHSLNHDYIPQEVYGYYLEVISLIDSLKHFSIVFLENDYNININDLNSSPEKVRQNEYNLSLQMRMVEDKKNNETREFLTYSDYRRYYDRIHEIKENFKSFYEEKEKSLNE